MIAGLVPPHVAAAEVFADPPRVELFDDERAAVATAGPERRAEFAAVRYCARRALHALGYPTISLPPDRRGAPRWPAGIVGSMTHCPGYRAAVVARRSHVAAIGIDAEPNSTLPVEVVDLIAHGDEGCRLKRLRAIDRCVSWDRLLFSAKESLFKAWFTVTRAELEFDEAHVELDAYGSFRARLRRSVAEMPTTFPSKLAGRWTLDNGLLVTAVVVPTREECRHPSRCSHDRRPPVRGACPFPDAM